MNEFEEKLKSTIESHDPPFESGDDPSMRELLVTTFRGKMRKWTFLVYAYIVFFSAVALAAGVWFLESETVKEQILYATMFQLAFLMAAILELCVWILMHRNATTREVKRLELRVVELIDTLGREREEA